MELKGIHHITAITGHAPLNVEFYVRVMGLRLVKKTVNFDVPDIYHLYYADETGTPGSILTFFEYPGARRGRHGSGMIHTIGWGVSGGESLDFWERRLSSEGLPVDRDVDRLRSSDPEGLGLELVVEPPSEPVLAADWPEIPQEHALRGFSGVRVYGQDPRSAGGTMALDSDTVLTKVLGFERAGSAAHPGGESSEGAYALTTGARRALYLYEGDPGAGVQGAGTVHHIAWAADAGDHELWRRRVQEARLHPTPIIDRQYFKSIYFREPSGVLFEIATIGPGFAIDESEETLGETLRLPPQYEAYRDELEQRLTPITNPRQVRAR
jgi:glyoxalase family protein